MDTYDIFMVVVLIGATIFGAWKGFAWQLASIASLTVSYFVALKFSPMLAPMFGEQAPFNRFVAMLAIYLATSMGIWLGFRLVGGMIDRLKLKEFDHQIGALFGLAKGGLLCVAITLFAVTLLADEQRASIINSRSGYYIASFLNEAHAVMPEEIHDMVHPYIHKAQETMGQTPVHGDDHFHSDPSQEDHLHGEGVQHASENPFENPFGDIPRTAEELERNVR